MHAKTDSEGTSIDASWPPRSPRRPVYYVQSPSNHDVEKMSYGSSPTASPTHHYYHCSPIHHSRESSTSRFSASLKNPRSLSAWKHVQIGHGDDDDDDDDEMDGRDGRRANNVRLYLCLVFLFFVLFAVFSLILWGASRSYKPKVFVRVSYFFCKLISTELTQLFPESGWSMVIVNIKLILLFLVTKLFL